MFKRHFNYALFISFLAVCSLNTAQADAVKILAADFHNTDGRLWTVSVTLEHGDTGWDHFADRWRLVDGTGKILGERILVHPHIDEQPFTRNLTKLQLPAGTNIIFVEAHDKVHGWSAQRLQVDLGKAQSGRLKIEAN